MFLILSEAFNNHIFYDHFTGMIGLLRLTGLSAGQKQNLHYLVIFSIWNFASTFFKKHLKNFFLFFHNSIFLSLEKKTFEVKYLAQKIAVSHFLQFTITELPLFRRLYQSVIQSADKAMAPHSSILAWTIPWMEEPGLQSMGSLRVRHD